MKVLFAISNEEVSESIVKRYQAEYKQIISSKNVYYFNAILKEIQKDKTYDRIVISEDLEAFTHSQYDQIDKFIFDKLDSISDEASNGNGGDIPIILICTDRRSKSEQILVKLFGIGVYNALIGTDRSVEEVCKLLNRPRTKKEAKDYYKIDSDEVNYAPESEDEVSEIEIQNILAHYKRLGKNENQYVESFNNIAAQYNDKQLRVISKVLPLNVRAVLEEKSPKYQKIMSFSNSISDDLRRKKNEDTGPTSKLLQSKVSKKILTEPVVIPSAVDMQNVRKLGTKRTVNIQRPTVSSQREYQKQIVKTSETNINRTNTPIGTEQMKTVMPGVENNTQTSQQQRVVMPGIEQEPQVQPVQQPQVQQPQPEPSQQNTVMLGVEQQPQSQQDMVMPEPEIQQEEQPKKRGRGRPRKNPPATEQVTAKPRRRGRPRKNPLPETVEQEPLPQTIEEQNTSLVEENVQETKPLVSSNVLNESVLPGFESEPTQSSYQQPQKEPQQNPFEQGVNNTQPQQPEQDPFNQGFNTQPQQPEQDPFNQGFNTKSQQPEQDPFNQGFNTKSQQPEQDPFNQSYNTQPQQPEQDPFNQGYNTQPQQPEQDPFNQGYNAQPQQPEQNPFNQGYNKQPQMGTETTQSYDGYEEYNSQKETYPEIDISRLLTPDKKLVACLGTSKNGTSFIVNNLAELTSSMGIKTAILDTTSNRNSYYIYTKNEEALRETALNSFDSLINKNPEGIQVNKNLTVFTSLPDENDKVEHVDEILETLVKNYSLVLIDTDFNTPIRYFKQVQELYLVQSLDILTIQPLTAFLRKLKSKDALEERKIRIVLNKAVKVKGIQEKTIIGGMAYYTDPAMSYMTELFDRNTAKYITIPFEDETYIRYLENIINCEVTLKGYSKVFMQSLKELANMVYPLNGQPTYRPPQVY